MNSIPVIAIFDVGKTNKKLFLFDENYRIVYERSARFTETVDEESDPCENLETLRLSIFESLREIFKMSRFTIKAINFSAYGASFVHVDEKGMPVAPLYNYLKDYPETLKQQFYREYGGEAKIARETSSPILGNLNSGMQLYRIKYQNPGLFSRIKFSMHLPQYLSFLITGKPFTDITSLGCHTGLWDYQKCNYHDWVYKEKLVEKFAPLVPSDMVIPNVEVESDFVIGVGLHDSSAALIPYLVNFNEPFALISTGTWCISLNPFNNTPITDQELADDCLCYMQYKGIPIKSSRLFAGHEHDVQTKRIAARFHMNTSVFKSMSFDGEIITKLKNGKLPEAAPASGNQSAFASRDISSFKNYTEAYHQLMLDIIDQQGRSTRRILEGTKVRRIFVDGGFSKNAVYMNLLAMSFPELEVFAASMAQATAVGAAIAIHKSWNSKPLPADIIELKYYSNPHSITL